LQQVNEPLLDDGEKRYVLFPIRYLDLYQMYKLHQACYWSAEEADLEPDLYDWDNKLTSDERNFLKKVLAFFAASDGIVVDNLARRFMAEVKAPEALCFYGWQTAMENIHSETYSLLINTYIRDELERLRLFNAVDNSYSIKRKADWALKWLNSDASFAERVVAFALVEGVFFSASFCSIFWMADRGLLKGLTFTNELIARDEGLHCEFACKMLSHLKNKPSQALIATIIEDGVQVELDFVDDILPNNLLGMNKEKMGQYVKFCADRLSRSMGCENIYNAKNPFDFMENISINIKHNFFERRNSCYPKAPSVLGKNSEFTMDADY